MYQVSFNFKGKKKRHLAGAGGRVYNFKTKSEAEDYAKGLMRRYRGERVNARVRKVSKK